MNRFGTLHIVSTPIGNLEDITLRAIRTLKEVDLIAAEDTRVTVKLLKYFGIDKPLTSYFEYNKLIKGDYLIRLLKEGKNIALVSDAGTPCVSDSGYLLVDEALKNGVNVVSVPGASAVISALSISGLDSSEFIFLGFLKRKSGKRKKEIEKYKGENKLVVFFESPHRIIETLRDIQETLGEVYVVVTREMTKKFEEVIRGYIREIIKYFETKKILGEFCVIIKQTVK